MSELSRNNGNNLHSVRHSPEILDVLCKFKEIMHYQKKKSVQISVQKISAQYVFIVLHVTVHLCI